MSSPLNCLVTGASGYWRSISPFHRIVFGGMLKTITAAAERAGDTPHPVAH